jgi:cell division protein FtsB
MRLFSERASMLEEQNRALKKTARERAERIDELERELQQMTRELERLKAENEFYFKRVAELEEHNRVVTEAATKYSLWGQKLFRELATLDPNGAPRRDFGTGSWM